MNPDYMFACGIVWQKTADLEAGWTLIEALESADPEERMFAQSMLVATGKNAFDLLESALGAGAISPETAGPCMAEILRAGGARNEKGGPAARRLDWSLC